MEDVSLKNRKRLPKALKQKKKDKILKNIIISIIVTLYFMFLNLGFANIDIVIYNKDLKVFSCALLFIAILFFEKGYKNDNESIFLSGIEVMIVAFVTLIMQFKIYETSNTTQIFLSIIFMIFIVYYIIKSLIQVHIIDKEYVMSDVKEIVKNNKK